VLFVSWWISSEQIRNSAPLATRLLQCSVLFLGQIVLTSYLLALFNQLTAPLLISINIAISFVVTVIGIRKKGLQLPSGKPSFFFFNVKGEDNVFNLILLTLIIFLSCLTLLKGFFFGPVSTDGLWYHVPMALLMKQNHNLAPVGQIFIDAYPRNIEIWFHWILASSGSERWLDVGQLPFFFVNMLATYCIAKLLGSNESTSRAGALLSCFAPVVFSQLGTAHIDVAVSALFLIHVDLWVLPSFGN